MIESHNRFIMTRTYTKFVLTGFPSGRHSGLGILLLHFSVSLFRSISARPGFFALLVRVWNLKQRTQVSLPPHCLNLVVGVVVHGWSSSAMAGFVPWHFLTHGSLSAEQGGLLRSNDGFHLLLHIIGHLIQRSSFLLHLLRSI